MLAWMERISTAGDFIFGPIDHDFVESVYFFDPNGYALEITYKTGDHDAVITKEESHARAQIAEWTARTRAQKVEVFGAEKIDSRCTALRASANKSTSGEDKH
jgi:catechol-2,3-dioxygenase